MRTHHARLAVTAAAALAIVLPLSGCLVAENDVSVGDLAGSTIQEGLDSASDALADAANIMDATQSDIANALDALNRSLSQLANAPETFSQLFGEDGVASKAQTITIEDAQDGTVLAQITEADQIRTAAASLSAMDFSGWKLVSSRPDEATAERTIVFSQDETVKLGQDANTVETSELMRVTTYADSPIIQLTVPSIDSSFNLELPAEDIAAIRELANR